MGLRVAWVDGPEANTLVAEQVAARSRCGHAVTVFLDHAQLLVEHRRSPFDVVILRTTEPSSPFNANAVVDRLRTESPGTTVALCSGCRVHPQGSPPHLGCKAGIRVAHAADPDRFDRFIPKPIDWDATIAWLDGLEEDRGVDPISGPSGALPGDAADPAERRISC